MVTEFQSFGWEKGDRNMQSLGLLRNAMEWMPPVVQTLQEGGTVGSEEGGSTREEYEEGDIIFHD